VDHRLRVALVVVLGLVLVALLLVPAVRSASSGAAATIAGGTGSGGIYPATGRPTLYEFSTDT
jgi:hypothetical protein